MLALRLMTLPGFHVPNKNHNSSIRCLGLFSFVFLLDSVVVYKLSEIEMDRLPVRQFALIRLNLIVAKFISNCVGRDCLSDLCSNEECTVKINCIFSPTHFSHKIRAKMIWNGVDVNQNDFGFFLIAASGVRGFALIIFSTVCYLISSIDRRHRSASLQCLLYSVFFGHFELYQKISRFSILYRILEWISRRKKKTRVEKWGEPLNGCTKNVMHVQLVRVSRCLVWMSPASLIHSKIYCLLCVRLFFLLSSIVNVIVM